jgi:nicotinamidase-related amidase
MKGLRVVLMAGLVAAAALASSSDEATVLNVTLRFQQKRGSDGQTRWSVVEQRAQWNPKRTAIVVCDMWDDHWCPNAAKRVAELAVPMNAVLKAARERGVFIIHAPSSVTKFYEGTPQRKRAQSAPFAKTPAPLSRAERWGTNWCWPNPDREPELPIDDSDMGCDCDEDYAPHAPWTRQIATLEIADEDAITDNGQETWNLLQERKIDNVILMGVHLNMCVLGRPFGIRQMTYLGKNVVLMRDMTDTMYNPKKPPHVSHFEGTDLVIGHVERHWCPTITSTVFTGKPFFRFKDDPRWIR